MFEQRLQQRLRLLVVLPAVLILLIAGNSLTTAQSPDQLWRERVFDVYGRIHPRALAPSDDVAVIDIDSESLQEIGPWPWPRTAIAGLVSAATAAKAEAVVVALPLEGLDPLSPEVVARYWRSYDDNGDAVRLIGQLPTTNAALAAAAAEGETALGAGRHFLDETRWTRTGLEGEDWAKGGGTAFFSLPAAPILDEVDPGFGETGLVSVLTLPTGPDGRVRRSPLIWAIGDRPAPSVALAGTIFSQGAVTLVPADRRLKVGGPPPAELAVGDQRIPLDVEAGARLWLPQDLEVTKIPAWRVLMDGEGWTSTLAGRTVFIGESVSTSAMVELSRGPQPIASVHALLLDQIRAGDILVRPGWAGPIEALGALLLGAGAVAAAIFLRPISTLILSVGLSLVVFSASFGAFQQSGILVDPLPPVMAMLGGPLAVLAMVVGNILIRDDAVRGAFHGALPAGTMAKLQSRNGTKLLRGVRRQVTVLSCGLRLPETVIARFEGRPDDFIRFTAAANDALRRTILAHGGTVDFGEDGRLLGYWNVPEQTEDQIEKACACALKMIDDVNALSENVQAAAFAGSGTDEGFAEGSLEIGLASSPCFAGPVGRGNRNRYAVLGEAVKFASALRQRAPSYGPAIITDDTVFDGLRHHYAFLDLDVVKTTEKAPVRTIYGLVGNPFLKASKAFRQLADTQRELVLAWRQNDLSATTVQLQKLRGIPGVPDAYIELFEQRLAEARAKSQSEMAKSEPAEVLAI